MTELSRQLSKINKEYGASGSAATARMQPSLIWSAQEASHKSLDDVFNVGRNGFLGLVGLDKGFQEYEEALFGADHVGTDRQLLSKDDNLQLDADLARFLRLLCSYLLHPAAVKALEWLMRRFRVHELNVDAVVSCALPYHETNLFVKIVQCLRLRPPSSSSTALAKQHTYSQWQWLEPMKKTGLPLPRALIVERCLRAPELFLAIATQARDAVREGSHCRPLIALYTSTAVGVLCARDAAPQEALVNQLLPFLFDSLEQSLSTEYQLSAHLIVAQLARRVELQPRLAASLSRHLVDSLRAHSSSHALTRSALLTLLALAQHQPLLRFSRKALRHLLAVPELFAVLSDASVAQAYSLEALVNVLVLALSSHLPIPDSLPPLLQIVTQLPLSRANVLLIVKKLFSRISSHDDNSEDNDDEKGKQ
ncbi:MAG: hypothetical protein Q8P67_20420, partial [archaeon]|nr:hypothetical protein [archaeon]